MLRTFIMQQETLHRQLRLLKIIKNIPQSIKIRTGILRNMTIIAHSLKRRLKI